MISALLLIDLQKAIDHPSWGVRNNPQAEAMASRLLSAWRTRNWPIFHIRHDSTEPGSAYRPGQPGNEFKPETSPLPHETVIAKNVQSAFTGTGLEQRLRDLRVDSLVVCGVITNNSVESTVRHGSCLGFRIRLVEDACFTFARSDWHGRARSAEEVHAMSLANLDGEYCAVVTTQELLGA